MLNRRCSLALIALLFLLPVAGCDREPEKNGEGEAALGDSPEPPPVHFYREYVVVEPSTRVCRVNGLYFMRNLTDRTLEMGFDYPFPVGGPYAFPYQVFVHEVTDEGERAMGFVPGERSVTFRMRFGPGEERRFRVRYAQQIRGGRATYIVTTTRLWERPIELAEFEIRIPPELEDVSLSFDPDSSATRNDTTVHYLREIDFYPDEDIVITWDD